NMLTIQQPPTRLCDGLTRRQWLHVGSLGALGLGWPQFLAPPANSAEPALRGTGFGQAKRVILLFLLGGPPQHETWDPKPDAPEEVRGAFGTIATATPGLRVGELMPQVAGQTNKIAV